MCEAGKFVERRGSDELSFAPELHAANHGSQVHIAAAFTGSKKCALNLNSTGKYGSARICDSETAICVTVKSDFCAGITAREAANNLGDFFRAGAASGVAHNQPADLLANALLRQLVKVLQAALAQIGFAIVAIFVAAASGVHGVFKVHDHL